MATVPGTEEVSEYCHGEACHNDSAIQGDKIVRGGEEVQRSWIKMPPGEGVISSLHSLW